MISNLTEDSSKQMNSVRVWGGKAATQSSATWLKKFQQGNGDFKAETNRDAFGEKKKEKSS